jgi:hypothetical protein
MFTTLLKKTTITPAVTLLAGSFAAVPNIYAADLAGPTAVVVVRNRATPLKWDVFVTPSIPSVNS